MATKIMNWLKKDELVRLQIQLHLMILNIYVPTRKEFCRQFKSKSTMQVKRTQIAPLLVRNESKQTEDNRCDIIPDDDWYFPKLPLWRRIHNYISSFLLGWVFFKFFMPDLSAKLGKWFCELIGIDTSNLKLRCFNFGKYVVHFEVPIESVGCLLAWLHLVWRLAQLIFDRPFKVDLLLYLMQPRDNIERFLKKINSFKLMPTMALDNHLNDYERFLCHITCYRLFFWVKNKNGKHQLKVSCNIRPNRTLEAREKLVNQMAMETFYGFFAMVYVVSLKFFYNIISILFNQYRYHSHYPDCDPDLSRKYMFGNVSHWDYPHITGRPLYQLTIFFDFLENEVIELACGFVLFYSLIFINYISSDLYLYWRRLTKIIERLRSETIRINATYKEESPEYMKAEERIELEVYDLQVALADFFNQIKQGDLMVSDVLTHFYIIWLSSFGCSTYEAATVYIESHDYEFAVFCIMASFVIIPPTTLASILLLKLQRACKLYYTAICSLMAHDRTKRKLQYLNVLDYYVEGNRCCFTLIQEFPFSSSNFVALVGWSISCFLVLDSIFRH